VISGGLIGGLSQQGEWKMDARFSRRELIRRVEAIASQKDKIFIHNEDAQDFILNFIPQLPQSTLVYCDPPYYEKSSRLYLDHYKKDDHGKIASVIQENLRHKWMVSYDKSLEILKLYSERRAFLYSLRYNASKRYEGQELFVFSDSLDLPECSTLSCIGDKVANAQPAKELLSQLAS
jgi:DNA adenine methylase